MEDKDKEILAKTVEELEEFAIRTGIHLLGIVTYMEKDKEITHWLFAGNLDVALDRIRERFGEAIKNLEKDKEFYTKKLKKAKAKKR